MLSVVIINFKNPPLLRLCLRSVISSISSNFKYELLVVDSESSVETRNVIGEFNGVRIVPFKRNIGYTKGVNEGIRAGKGNYFFILNPDIVPKNGAIEKLFSYMENNSDIGLMGPRLLNFDGTAQDSCFRFYTLWTIIARRTILGKLPIGKNIINYFLMKDINLSKPSNVDWLMGSALLTKKDAVNKVGLMDENLFLYMTDVDWAKRFWENGYRVVYYPESEMFHYHKRGSKGRWALLDIFFRKETRWHIADAVKYFRKYGIT